MVTFAFGAGPSTGLGVMALAKGSASGTLSGPAGGETADVAGAASPKAGPLNADSLNPKVAEAGTVEAGLLEPEALESEDLESETLGRTLRRAREASGRSLAEMSALTRVHVRYLAALEQSDWSALPNRVFAVGHVRAYAGALSLDEQLAVERFKRESPDPSVPLQAPIGIAFEDVKRYSPRVIAAVAAIGLAVVGWNVIQRVSLIDVGRPSDIREVPQSWSEGWTLGTPGATEIRLEPAQPAPADQTIPALYVTPGLEDALSADMEEAAPTAAAPVQRAFNPRGAVYGAAAAAGGTQVVLQARKAASVVVRMADGRVLFARQLAAGEAWRAPMGVQAVIDVSDPAAFDIYLNGEHGGVLSATLTPLAQLNSRAQTLARQAAAEANARAEAARVAASRPAAAAAASGAN